MFLETGVPPYLGVWMTAPSPPPPSPISEGLDPPLKALPFSTLGFVTRMQSLIKASQQNKSTASMRVRRRECMPLGCKKSNKAPLLQWYLLPPNKWQVNARGITADWLNFYQTRKERIIVLQFHGFASVSFALLRSALFLTCVREAHVVREELR